MNTELTLKLVKMLKEHSTSEVDDSLKMAKTIYSIFDNSAPRLSRARRVPARPRQTITPAELATAEDWTSAIGKYFVQVERRGMQEVPMKSVINYIVANTERTSVTGSAYHRYITAVESIGWTREGGGRPRMFVKV